MNVQTQIKTFIASQSDKKQSEIQTLHNHILKLAPKCKLWFSDGRDENNKVVTNPSIGYGSYTIHYADGSHREFYRIGVSPNKTGISVYVMGLKDKNFLINSFGKTIGKAKVTGYCIRFNKLEDIHLDVLEKAIRAGFATKEEPKKKA